MDFVKKNKYTIIVIVLFLLLVFAGYQVKRIFFPNVGKAIYGDRLEGIEEVKIKDQQFEQLIGSLKENEKVVAVKKDVRGRLVNIIITVKEDTSVDQAKELAPDAIASLDDKQKSYYDFQVLVQKEDEKQNDFPIIGYKHHNNQDFVFTKNREVTSE